MFVGLSGGICKYCVLGRGPYPPKRATNSPGRYPETETMPTDACQWFNDCNSCSVLLKPKARKLLRVLFIWQCALPSDSTRSKMLNI